jgi:thiamine pyrophosphokinase
MSMKNSALVLANGGPPTKRLMKKLLAGLPVFVCADGGANTAVRYKLKPVAVVGDMDSVSARALRSLRKAEIHKVSDDNSTDLEKSLAWLIERGSRIITVAGATGGRLDHFIGNLSAMVKFSAKATIRFVDDSGEWIYVGRSKNLNLPVGATVSLIPLSHCDGIVTKGLRWNLNFESLELGVRDATSNLVDATPVHISVAKGNLIVFYLYKLAFVRRTHRTKKARR